MMLLLCACASKIYLFMSDRSGRSDKSRFLTMSPTLHALDIPGCLLSINLWYRETITKV
jgi:hypothetical protein